MTDIDNEALWRALAAEHREEAHCPPSLVVFDTSQRVVEDSLHAELAFSTHVDDFAQALDEEIHPTTADIVGPRAIEGLSPRWRT